MVSFGNIARISSLCVGFHLGTLHGYFFHCDFYPNLNFLLEHQIKPVLTVSLHKTVTYHCLVFRGSTKSCLYASGFRLIPDEWTYLDINT